MGRGWSWQTRVKHMERRRIRSMTYRQIENVVRPPSADGTRRCADCANFPTCTRDRRGNHAVCFVRGNQKTVSVNREETGSDSVKTWILLFSVIFGTIGYLILLIVSGTGVRCILLALVIFVLILRSIR